MRLKDAKVGWNASSLKELELKYDQVRIVLKHLKYYYSSISPYISMYSSRGICFPSINIHSILSPVKIRL